MSAVDHHVSLFGEVASTNGAEPGWLRPIRKAAIESFAQLGFPTSKLEDWKHTNVASIAKTPFELSKAPGTLPASVDLMSLDPSDEASARLVFLDGFFSPELSALRRLPDGARAESLATRLEDEPGALDSHLTRHAPFDTKAFVALNTAFFRDGAAIHVGRDVEVPGAIHIVFVGTDAAARRMAHPRVLIVVEEGSRAAVVESYLSLDGAPALTNAVTEVVLEANATLDHVRWQHESDSAFHLSALAIHQARDSRYTSHAISSGAGLTRNDIHAVLDGEGVDCVLNGLFAASGDQHVDNHTTIDHARPHGTSSELYKGILSQRARGVFNGRIIVRPDAQKTDARQSNRNLLMSDRAEIDTMPQLEIYADDVRCTHGSTIGHLEEDALFYLRSRGIDEATARGILTRAFAWEITRGIHSIGLRTRIERSLLSRLATHALESVPSGPTPVGNPAPGSEGA